MFIKQPWNFICGLFLWCLRHTGWYLWRWIWKSCSIWLLLFFWHLWYCNHLLFLSLISVFMLSLRRASRIFTYVSFVYVVLNIVITKLWFYSFNEIFCFCFLLLQRFYFILWFLILDIRFQIPLPDFCLIQSFFNYRLSCFFIFDWFLYWLFNIMFAIFLLSFVGLTFTWIWKFSLLRWRGHVISDIAWNRIAWAILIRCWLLCHSWLEIPRLNNWM